MHALKGTVDSCGYGGQQIGTICDARGPYPSILHTLKPFFVEFDWLIMLTSRLDTYISRYGDFCSSNNDNNNNYETTDYFTPCACVRGTYTVLRQQKKAQRRLIDSDISIFGILLW